MFLQDKKSESKIFELHVECSTVEHMSVWSSNKDFIEQSIGKRWDTL